MDYQDCSSNSLHLDVQKKITEAKLLVVGAGGIGCELIKNLVLVGFKNFEIIDLDTIDVSNLNRQFLFQKKHVGKPKALVAHEAALSLRPDVNVLSHHASIFNPEFSMEYFKKFDIVLNALDNRAARNHVNRLCLAADVPLVESGSSGYLGQVNVIKKGRTECYECSPKPRQKTFPGCTIRNTPSELIHCVVWAKYLFNQLFGEEDADRDVSPDTADPEAALSNNTGDIERTNTKIWAKNSEYDPQKIFNKLFKTDIEYLLSMDKLWENRNPPKPIEWYNHVTNCHYSTTSQNVLTLEENMQVFSSSLTDLKEMLKKEGEDGILVWDKDNDSAISFVSSSANIRAAIFGIPQKSIFEIKSMAGNIIPAIATTNAIVAGLIVMQALCILQNKFDKCRNVFVSRVANPSKRLIAPCVLDPPRPSCYVCVEKPEVTFRFDTNALTLGCLKEKILKSHLGMIEPDVEFEGTGIILLSSEEGESDNNLPKCLNEFGVQHGSRLRADDFSQNFNIVINILHGTELSEGKEFELVQRKLVNEDNGQPITYEGEKGPQEVGAYIVGEKSELDEEQLIKNKASNDSETENRKRKPDLATDDDREEQDSKRIKMCSIVNDDDIQIIE